MGGYENITCPICDTGINENSFIRTFVSPYNDLKYKLYYCPNCQLKFWEPLKMIPEFFENEGFEDYFYGHIGLKELRQRHKRFLKVFPIKRGYLLDVGCGDGIFLYYLKKAFNFNVYGIDLDRKLIKVAKRKFSLENVFTTSLKYFIDFVEKQNVKFDVITFFEVLEHQDNPKGFLNDIKKLLKPKGYIAGSVPNRERVFAELIRKNSLGDFPPYHFMWFSKDALRFFFKKTRLYKYRVLSHNIFSNGTSYGSRINIIWQYFKKIRKKVRLISKDLKYSKNNRRIALLRFLRTLRNFSLAPLALPFLPVFNLKGYGILFSG
ncbi:MAG: Ubiquinone biosynthesis O-methyltransferase [Candidatus Methanoperedenaceae archaeon GB50]|nr:MAG: Ubiquinone biosynthesis O-methyltransferase [Candidatus Methanoperedenaceae archaeon GB50]